MKTIAKTRLPDSVKQPNYDQSRLETKIVHLGFGAFHRAHQALYTHDVAQKSDSNWGICEVNLFSGKKPISQLKQQGSLYSIVEKIVEKKAGKESFHTNTNIIGITTGALHPALDGIAAIIEKMAEPQIAIVSLTITEKGYCCDLSTGQLNLENELIVHDLANPTEPKSAIAYIVQALKCRYERKLMPFSVLSCDNVQENGHVARAAVINFARLLDTELAQWIEDSVTFPCTMVDRIVPAMTPEAQAEITNVLGVNDPIGIICEPFRQWVIEDDFIQINGQSARPNWNLAGAEFVSDVVPFEEMKLRMLNGSHSFLAYLGYLGGYQHIADTMENSDYQHAALRLMMAEQAPTLALPFGTNIKMYADSLITRFSNSALKHKTWQIAMDGSQKLPQRLLHSVRFHLLHDTEFDYLAMGIAAWMRYVSGYDEQGNVIDVKDPMANTFKALHSQNDNSADIVKALLSIETIFGKDLIDNAMFVTIVTNMYQLLVDKGARSALTLLNNR